MKSSKFSFYILKKAKYIFIEATTNVYNKFDKKTNKVGQTKK